MKKGLIVGGMRVPRMDGIWGIEIQAGRRFGNDVANKMGAITGLKGLIHSDEKLEKYQLSEAEISKIRKSLKCSEEDLFILDQNFVLIFGSGLKIKSGCLTPNFLAESFNGC